MRTLSRMAVAAVAALISICGAGAAQAGERGTDPAARSPLAVPGSFVEGVVAAATARGHLPGANDWSCRPSADKPRPVVLVHGTGGGAVTNWGTYGPLLHNEGYCVYTLTYGALPGQPWPISEVGALSDILHVSVPQVAAFVERVLNSTGADQVDLVGHSQGTIVSGLVAKSALPGKVHTVVSLAPPWDTRGNEMQVRMEQVPGLLEQVQRILPPAMSQLSADSEAFRTLWAGGSPYAPGVDYLNIVTRYDQMVTPYTAGVVPGPRTTNVVLQDGCEENRSDHAAIAADARASDFVLAALDPGSGRQPRCEVAPRPAPRLPGLPGA